MNTFLTNHFLSESHKFPKHLSQSNLCGLKKNQFSEDVVEVAPGWSSYSICGIDLQCTKYKLNIILLIFYKT